MPRQAKRDRMNPYSSAPSRPLPLQWGFPVLLFAVVSGCTIASPRPGDPWEHFNRKVYTFNDTLDKAVIRPAAMGYRKVTTANMRRVLNNFYGNVNMPINIVNEVLQGDPKRALRSSERFLINTTVGFAGLFDPASELNLPPDETDFGITLAKWGVPEGPYLVLPFIGSTTPRDVLSFPVDAFVLSPLAWYSRDHSFEYAAQYLPEAVYLVTLRSVGVDAEALLEGIYDPYVFYRDAYHQRRIYKIYNGDPPESMLEDTDDIDVNKLLDEQHQYEKSQQPSPQKDGGPPVSPEHGSGNG